MINPFLGYLFIAIAFLYLVIKFISNVRKTEFNFRDYLDLFAGEFFVASGIALLATIILVYLGYGEPLFYIYNLWGYIAIFILSFLSYGMGKTQIYITEKKILGNRIENKLPIKEQGIKMKEFNLDMIGATLEALLIIVGAFLGAYYGVISTTGTINWSYIIGIAFVLFVLVLSKMLIKKYVRVK